MTLQALVVELDAEAGKYQPECYLFNTFWLGVNATGRCLMPLTKLIRKRSAGPVTEMSGSRAAKPSKMSFNSRRARLAPKQKCAPPAPNAKW